MKALKILICTNHSYMYWQFRRELTQELLKRGEVILSTPFVGHEDDLKKLGCRVLETDIDRRGINPFTDFKLFRFYWKLLKAEKPDLVITYSIKPNIYMGLSCRLQKVPYCANVQGLGTAFQKQGLAQAATVLYRTALKKAKTTFFENEENAREFQRRHIQNAESQTILSGAGVNLEYYTCQPYPHNDKIHFLYLGRIMKEKGIDELFYAARKLNREKKARQAPFPVPASDPRAATEIPPDNFDFMIDLAGFYEDEYKEQVERLEQEGIAKFHGFQEDPRPCYSMADCVVLPSYHEGMSNVLLEAAATGRPIITSDIPGCREAVCGKPEKNGLLVSVRDGETLYEAMKSMMNASRQEREQMGRAGRTYMEEQFDKKLVVKETLKNLLS
ncbi:MAG: glycosyltransferase family 4 protein [Lachnospiraceae bacterium]|nr:glycosyltransferase family 4 protein [Lachnospiraceae bacterium]